MPDHVHITFSVGGQGATRLNALVEASNEISLSFKSGFVVVQTCIPKLRAAHLEPRDMNPPVPAERELSHPNGIVAYDTFSFGVHANWTCPRCLVRWPRDIEEVTIFTRFFVVDEMNRTLIVHDGARLNSIVGSSDDFDIDAGVCEGGETGEEQTSNAKQ